MMGALEDNFSDHLKKDAEAEADAYLNSRFRNLIVDRVVKNLKAKVETSRSRGTICVPAPYPIEEPEKLYPYAAMHSFDRREFLKDLDEAMVRRLSSGGEKVSAIVSANLDSTEEIMAEFKKLDTSGDGKLTREEIVRNCDLLHLSIEEAHRLFDRLDSDRSGSVDQVSLKCPSVQHPLYWLSTYLFATLNLFSFLLQYEFTKAVVEIENNAVTNLVVSICEGDAGRLHDGLMRHTRTSSVVDIKRLHVRMK